MKLKLIIVLSLVLYSQLALSQFNLFVNGATTDQLNVLIPSGEDSRYLVIKDRDSITIDSLLIESCSSGCIFTIEELNHATIYLLQLYQGQDIQDERWAMTSSTSSGMVEVYFTTSIDTTVSNGFSPVATEGAILEDAIITAIEQANFSIDVMLYNVNRRPIINALSDAHNRGVKIRYLTSDNTNNIALSNPTPDFPILIGNLGSGLMHNKVFVIDTEDADRALVITGATNMTTGQIFTDHNHMLFIQDQSLARAYEKEVDEMWGSRQAQPNPSLSRFGSAKLDDTPHEIYIHGVLYELYFSPSDNTTFKIVNTLNTAQVDCYFALLLFTRSNLASSIINLHNRGIDVKGLMNNTFENGSQYSTLQSNGVFVLHYTNGPMLHHKYCIIDENGPPENAKLITGSHNWSNNAENRNDENTLIIHDADLVNIFFQEFQARWCEQFAGDDCRLVTSVEDVANISLDYKVHFDKSSSSLYVFPELATSDKHTMQLFDVHGRMIYAKSFYFSGGETPHISSTLNLKSGIYFLNLTNQSSRKVVSFTVN